MPKLKYLLPALILAVLLAGTFYYAKSNMDNQMLPKFYEVPDFEFVTHKNDAFTKSNLASKISVVDFIFTNCPGICPVMSKKMAEIYTYFETNNDVQFISFSVDPARDSLQALVEYAERFGAMDDRWLFIRTAKEQIDDLYLNGFKMGGELPYGHTGSFVLMDTDANVRGLYNYDDEASLEQLKKDIKLLLGE